MASFLSMIPMLWPLVLVLSSHAENSSCVHDSVLLQTRSEGIPIRSISIDDVHEARVTVHSHEARGVTCTHDRIIMLQGDPKFKTVRVQHLNEPNTTSALWQPCSEQQLKQEWVPVGRDCLALNMIYIKVGKTGSSTTGGIMRRIASRHCLFGVTEELSEARPVNFEPAVSANHGHATCKVTLNQQGFINPAILVTQIRDPAARALSHFYWFESRETFAKPDEVIAYLQSNISGSYELDYIRLDNDAGVSQTIANYTLIMILERLPESLVVLKHLLRLEFCDLLFVSSKVATDPTGLSEQPPEVSSYFASPEFSKRYEPDLLLYAAANRSLDLWIDRIGRKEFQEDLAAFSSLLDQVKSQCSHETHPCYWGDNGCGYQCIDSICGEY